MRIIAKAKPIKIRVKSGGEEHSSLDSLRQNLCVQDLWPLIKDERLSRWLRQLGEMELAHAIEELAVEQLDDFTYLYVLSLFLEEDLAGHHVTDLYSLLSYWHDCEMRNSTTYVSLRKYLLNQYKGARFIYKRYTEEFSDGEWWDVFCNFEKEEDFEFLFGQGKLASNGFVKSDGSRYEKNIVRGKELIEKAAKLGNPKAIDWVNSHVFGVDRKLAMLTPETKEEIDNLVARWKRDKCAFTTMKKASDKEIVREVKQLLLEFKSLRSIYNWDGYASTSVKKEAERKYNKLDESDIFFKERKFVLALAEYNCDSHCKRSLFRLLAETHHYPLAQYMLNRPADGKIDGCYFATAEFPTQLNFIVNHLFEY